MKACLRGAKRSRSTGNRSKPVRQATGRQRHEVLNRDSSWHVKALSLVSALRTLRTPVLLLYVVVVLFSQGR